MKDFYLSNSEKLYLLKVARNSLEELFERMTTKEVKESFNELTTMNMKTGAFVTLHHRGELKGCIGRMESGEQITELVRKMTISSATQDHRFKSISREEINEIDIEISVLTPKIKINSTDEFDHTKHGIYIQKGELSGTFLPQVAEDTGWDKEELLGRCSRDKVGIGWFGWENADLYIYEVINFSESEFKV